MATKTRFDEGVSEALSEFRKQGEIMDDPNVADITFRKATRERFKATKKLFLRTVLLAHKQASRVESLEQELESLNSDIDLLDSDAVELREMLEQNGIITPPAHARPSTLEKDADSPPNASQSLPMVGTVTPASNGYDSPDPIVSCACCLWGIDSTIGSHAATTCICTNPRSTFYRSVTPHGMLRRCIEWDDGKSEVDKEKRSKKKDGSKYKTISAYALKEANNE